MAEMAISIVIGQLLPLLRDEANLLRGVHKEFEDIKDELESIQAFLKDADKRAASTEGDTNSERIKIWVKQVREAAFCIEDVIDEYIICLAHKPCGSGSAVLLHNVSHWFKTMKQRYQIASEIQDIKLSIRGIRDRSERYGFNRSFEQGTSSSRESRNTKWHDPRMAALYIEEAEVVGFETQKNRLINWLVMGRDERTVVSLVGMGGQGKTTLAKKVFDSKDVIVHFDYRVWITVSQSYNVDGLLRDMLLKLYKQKGEDPPEDFFEMDRGSLIDKVRNCLQQKRYVIVFDDVWCVHFWDDIEFAVIDNKNGSKIFITTRNLDVVVSCKRSSFIEVLELQPLTEEQSFQLFNKKAFRFDYDGCCPKELSDISYKIVKKCKGLPLAIVAIGGLLSTRDKNVFEWQRFIENLSFELKTDTHLIGIKEILTLSYDDLPYYLKSCMLYFGIYPEDYEVRSKRVIRHWIAEGFVKQEKGKTLEEVAEGYLTELIHRSLVQVSSLRIDGKAKGCHVHDLIREMVLEKIEDLDFCKHIGDDGLSSLSGIIRRLSITRASNGFMDHFECSRIRSLLCFPNIQHFLYFEESIFAKYRLLKVLDCESASWLRFPQKMGNLIHLKYLSFKNVRVPELPKSIGVLQNLETLDVRDTLIRELPNEISKLTKLRHLIGTELSFCQVKDGIGEMTSLQTLRNVNLGVDGAVELIKDLGKLKQLRDLGLLNFSIENGSILSSSINEMQHLEKLNVRSIFAYDESIDLNLISPPTMLRMLTLGGRLQEFPEFHNLVVLRLKFSYLTINPMRSLIRLQHLLILHIQSFISDEDLCLHFEDGGFQKLKELYIEHSLELRDIVIDKGALPSLKKLHLHALLGLEKIPTGIQHLEKLEVLYITRMEDEFVQHNSTTEDWNWIMEHVPLAEISTIDNRKVIRN